MILAIAVQGNSNLNIESVPKETKSCVEGSRIRYCNCVFYVLVRRPIKLPVFLLKLSDQAR